MTEHTRLMSIRTAGTNPVPLPTDDTDADSPGIRADEIHKDARGFTYQSVRRCDLDRIRDK